MFFLLNSKDGDNEFMNIIANEIGFQVRRYYVQRRTESSPLDDKAWFSLSPTLKMWEYKSLWIKVSAE